MNTRKGYLLMITILLVGVTHVRSWTRSSDRKEDSQSVIAIPDTATGTNGDTEIRDDKRSYHDVMLDPYSVLGFMSFATFIISILYNKYNKKGPQGRPMNTGGAQLLHSAGLNNVDTQQNVAYILKMASKILSKTSNWTTESTGNASALDNDVFYDYDGDDGSEVRSVRKLPHTNTT